MTQMYKTNGRVQLGVRWASTQVRRVGLPAVPAAFLVACQHTHPTPTPGSSRRPSCDHEHFLTFPQSVLPSVHHGQ